MKRFASLLGAIALGISVNPAVLVHGQVGNGGGQGAQGAAAPPDGAQTGAKAGAQIGVGGVQVGGQVGPGGVQAGAQVGSQAGGPQAQAGANLGGVRQAPWFNQQLTRRQLNLNEDQFNQLNRSYSEYWNRYNKDMTQLGRDLNDQQRMRRLQELEGSFNRDFSTSVERTFTDPKQRQRFNQLYLQYQGYGAFNDPTIQQRMNFNADQRRRLNELNTEWNTQMGRVGSEFRTGDEGISNRFREMRRQYDQRLNSILNEQQRQSWQETIGERFDFPLDSYFQSNTNVRTGAETGVRGGQPGANRIPQ